MKAERLRLARWWTEARHAVGAVIFPPRCAACDEALAAQPRFDLCQRCFEILEPNLGPRCPRCDLPGEDSPCDRCQKRPPPFDAARGVYLYGGPVADLIVGTKFRGREEWGSSLAGLLAEDPTVQEWAAESKALVPTPLGQRRGRERGYNQSAIIARGLGKRLGVPIRHALVRNRETGVQSDLPLSQRRPNLEGAFSPRQALAGTVILVDDVVTSGETARAAGLALLEAGAHRVLVVACARATL